MATAPEARPGSPAVAVSWPQRPSQPDRDQLSGPGPAVNPFMQVARRGHYAGALLPVT